jgi:hypothetical protein
MAEWTDVVMKLTRIRNAQVTSLMRWCRVNDRGECFRHAAQCGVGVGVFLFIRRSNVVLLRGSRQTVWFSPYLDVHGEEVFTLLGPFT